MAGNVRSILQSEADYHRSIDLFRSNSTTEFPADSKARRYFAESLGAWGWGWYLRPDGSHRIGSQAALRTRGTVTCASKFVTRVQAQTAAAIRVTRKA